MPTRAKDLKEKGNKLFQQGKFIEANDQYLKAIAVAMEEGCQENYHTIWGNLAHVNNKLNNFRESEKYARLAIRAKPDWHKGYYRAAQAALQLGRPAVAVELLDRGIDNCVDNDDLRTLRVHAVVDRDKRAAGKQKKTAPPPPPPPLVPVDSNIAQNNNNHRKGSKNNEPEHRSSRRPDNNIWSRILEETPPATELSDAQRAAARAGDPDALKQEMCLMVRRGSEALRREGGAREAFESYRRALKLAAEKRGRLKLTGAEQLSLRYCYALACHEVASLEALLSAEAELLVLVQNAQKPAPAAYYLLGKVYLRLNRFEQARQALETCEQMLARGARGETHVYPGTSDTIPDTARAWKGTLQTEVSELLEAARCPPRPDAHCRLSDCLSESAAAAAAAPGQQPQSRPAARRDIYYSDLDFAGFMTLECLERCRLEYHPACWRKLKDDIGPETQRTIDKDLLNRPCLTPDCGALIGRICTVGADTLPKHELTSDEWRQRQTRPAAKHSKPQKKSALATQKKQTGKPRRQRESEPARDIPPRPPADDPVQHQQSPVPDSDLPAPVASAAPYASTVAPPVDGELDWRKMTLLKRDTDELENQVGKKSKKKGKKKGGPARRRPADATFWAAPEDDSAPYNGPPVNVIYTTDADGLADRLTRLEQLRTLSFSTRSLIPDATEQPASVPRQPNVSEEDHALLESAYQFLYDYLKTSGPTRPDDSGLLAVTSQLSGHCQQLIAQHGCLQNFLLSVPRFYTLDGRVCVDTDAPAAEAMVGSAVSRQLGADAALSGPASSSAGSDRLSESGAGDLEDDDLSDDETPPDAATDLDPESLEPDPESLEPDPESLEPDPESLEPDPESLEQDIESVDQNQELLGLVPDSIDGDPESPNRNPELLDLVPESIDGDPESLGRDLELTGLVPESIDGDPESLDRDLESLDGDEESIDGDPESLDRDVESLDQDVESMNQGPGSMDQNPESLVKDLECLELDPVSTNAHQESIKQDCGEAFRLEKSEEGKEECVAAGGGQGDGAWTAASSVSTGSDEAAADSHGRLRATSVEHSGPWQHVMAQREDGNSAAATPEPPAAAADADDSQLQQLRQQLGQLAAEKESSEEELRAARLAQQQLEETVRQLQQAEPSPAPAELERTSAALQLAYQQLETERSSWQQERSAWQQERSSWQQERDQLAVQQQLQQLAGEQQLMAAQEAVVRLQGQLEATDAALSELRHDHGAQQLQMTEQLAVAGARADQLQVQLAAAEARAAQLAAASARAEQLETRLQQVQLAAAGDVEEARRAERSTRARYVSLLSAAGGGRLEAAAKRCADGAASLRRQAELAGRPELARDVLSRLNITETAIQQTRAVFRETIKAACKAIKSKEVVDLQTLKLPDVPDIDALLAAAPDFVGLCAAPADPPAPASVCQDHPSSASTTSSVGSDGVRSTAASSAAAPTPTVASRASAASPVPTSAGSQSTAASRAATPAPAPTPTPAPAPAGSQRAPNPAAQQMSHLSATHRVAATPFGSLVDEILAACDGVGSRDAVKQQLSQFRNQRGGTMRGISRPQVVEQVAAMVTADAALRAAGGGSAPVPAPSLPSQPSREECVMCREYYAPSQAMQLPCGHSFHALCLLKWKQQSGMVAFCPICRQPFTSDAEFPAL